VHGALRAARGEDEDGEDETEEENGEEGFHRVEQACVSRSDSAGISSSMLTTDCSDGADTEGGRHEMRRWPRAPIVLLFLLSRLVGTHPSSAWSRVLEASEARACVGVCGHRVRNGAVKGNETRVCGHFADDVRGSADACFTPSRDGVKSDA
jgi:hypothetical protein